MVADAGNQRSMLKDASADGGHDRFFRRSRYAARRIRGARTVRRSRRRRKGPPIDGQPSPGPRNDVLLPHGIADQSEVGELVDIGVFLDIFAVTLDDPEELCELFSSAPHSADQFAALERIGGAFPHSAAVLDALGQRLFDRKLATAARRAAIRHRSWMANRT